MNDFEINAEARDAKGSGASRRLRRAGFVPAVVYGGDKGPSNIQLQHNSLLKQSENEAFYSQILTLKTGPVSERVVLKDMQRHPFRQEIMHLDFHRVAENEALTIRVPLHFINEEEAVGVKTGGGIVNHLMTELEVTCLPKDLPEYIEVDVISLDAGDSLHIRDIKLPPGVEATALLHGGEDVQPVVSVTIPRGIESGDEEGEEGEAGEEGTEVEGDEGEGDDD